MFGFGWGEIVVIGIVALIAIGPKELPSVLRSIGFWMGKVRRMANEFQGQFQEALREAELSDLKKQAEEITSSVENYDPLKDTQKDIEKAFDFDDPLKDTPKIEAAPQATASHEPDAPPLPGSVPDGATLPAAAIPPVETPIPDLPMPELPAPVTEKDFAPASAAQPVAEAKPEPASGAKPAGSAS